MSNIQFKKVMRELEHFAPPHNPLVICLNRHMFFETEGRGITCMKLKVELKEYDTNYFKERIFQPPHYRYKYLMKTVKHTTVRFV